MEHKSFEQTIEQVEAEKKSALAVLSFVNKAIAAHVTVIAAVSIKGGVGKTHILIELAKCLAAAGKKVLVIDSDLNNSMSFHFFESDEEAMKQTDKKNLARALFDENNNLCDYIVNTPIEGIDLIGSSARLSDLRMIEAWRLKGMIHVLDGKYDVCLIDCHPTYDNIVLNACYAAEYVITPVQLDLFSYNAAMFMSKALPRDVKGLQNWFVLINGYNKKYEGAKRGVQQDYLKLYENAADSLPLMPKNTWLPWTAQIRHAVDYHLKVAKEPGIKESVYSPELYQAIENLAGCFFDDELTIPEAF
jgi:chromosome partitioning protein